MFCRSGRSYVVNEPEQIRQPRCDDIAVSSLAGPMKQPQPWAMQSRVDSVRAPFRR
jgi:hypothetical protein